MMLVTFADGSDWFKANWVFRQLAKDIVELGTITKDIDDALQQAMAVGMLDSQWVAAPIRAPLVNAIVVTAERTLSGEIAGWKEGHPDDEDRQRMYLEAIAELLARCRQEAR